MFKLVWYDTVYVVVNVYAWCMGNEVWSIGYGYSEYSTLFFSAGKRY